MLSIHPLQMTSELTAILRKREAYETVIMRDWFRSWSFRYRYYFHNHHSEREERYLNFITWRTNALKVHHVFDKVRIQDRIETRAYSMYVRSEIPAAKVRPLTLKMKLLRLSFIECSEKEPSTIVKSWRKSGCPGQSNRGSSLQAPNDILKLKGWRDNFAGMKVQTSSQHQIGPGQTRRR